MWCNKLIMGKLYPVIWGRKDGALRQFLRIGQTKKVVMGGSPVKVEGSCNEEGKQ